jgi:hypothetical protein
MKDWKMCNFVFKVIFPDKFSGFKIIPATETKIEYVIRSQKPEIP